MRLKGIWSQNNIFLKSLTISLTLSILGSWGITNWLGTNTANINLTLEGLSTCFNRVSQNYSGKMIGRGQAYTASDFYLMTEQCFSDLERVMKTSYFLRESNDIQSNFKELIKKAYWFHRMEVTENEFVDNKSELNASFTTKYQEMEEISDKLNSLTTGIRNNINDKRNVIFYVGGVSVLALALVMVLYNGSSISRVSKNSVEADIANSSFNQQQEDKTTINLPQEAFQENPKKSVSIPQPLVAKADANTDESIVTPGPEKFDVFFNRFLRLIGPRLIRRGANFDFTVDPGIPRVLHPEQTQRELELFFERAMNFNLGQARLCRIDCYQLNSHKTEIRYYDNGVCLLNSMKHFKNVKSTDGLILGVEYKHRLNSQKLKKKIKSLFKGSKKDLLREIQG